MNLQSGVAVIVVNKSLRHIEVYLKIDGKIVGGVSSKHKTLAKLQSADKMKQMADMLHKIATDKKVKKAVLQRNGNIYTGQVKMLAEAIREKGITI